MIAFLYKMGVALGLKPLLKYLIRRRAEKRVNRSLPPRLNRIMDPGALVGENHLLRTLPCTKYTDIDVFSSVNSAHSAGIPAWIARFDWVVGWNFGWANPLVPPRSVLCNPDGLRGLAAAVRKNSLGRGFFAHTVLVFGGGDRKISSQNARDLVTVREGFQAVFYEAYDEPVAGVGVMPKGLREPYIRAQETAIQEALGYDGPRELNVLAAWGRWYPHLDSLIEDRRLARDYVRSSSVVEELMLEPADYWRKLSRSSFMMCPEGTGVQTPKMAEAILAGCIPICRPNPAFVELFERGVPIVLVEDWRDIDFLDLAATRRALEPTLEKFRKIYSSIDLFWQFSFGHPAAATAVKS